MPSYCFQSNDGSTLHGYLKNEKDGSDGFLRVSLFLVETGECLSSLALDEETIEAELPAILSRRGWVRAGACL